MAQKTSLTKRLMIDKANNLIIVVMAAAAFVTVFSLVSSKTLINQSEYQNRVISAKNKAVRQLNSDITAVQALNSSYQAFNAETPNVIGGDPAGTGQNQGDNADIILDALPYQYDFPALITSLNSLLSAQGVQVSDLSGTDEQLTESTSASTNTPQAVDMPFSVTLSGSYQAIENVINQLQASIRPMQIQTIQLSGNQSSMSMELSVQTYFQPAKSFKISSEAVR